MRNVINDFCGAKAAKFAKSFLKTAAKDITFFTVTGEALPTDTFWCKSEEADYFRALYHRA
jgi:hypothetical protein